MLKNILAPLTTATSSGVVIRYVATIISSVVAILSIFGLLTPEQAAELIRKMQQVTAQMPELIGAIGALTAILIPVYAAMTKSSSDKAAEVAKEVDKKMPPEMPVKIETPPGVSDIVVPGKTN